MNSKNGFSLVEVIIALGIFTLLGLTAVWFFVDSLRMSRVIGDQLAAQTEGRRVLREILDEVRRAEPSSIGAYPIEAATTNTFIFFANVDADNYRERVRYWISGTDLFRGSIKPSGVPLQYLPQDEQVVTLAHDIANSRLNLPLFTYYDQYYRGAQPPLAQPVTTTDIRVVQIEFELEKNPNQIPVPVRVRSSVMIRNLKANL